MMQKFTQTLYISTRVTLLQLYIALLKRDLHIVQLDFEKDAHRRSVAICCAVEIFVYTIFFISFRNDYLLELLKFYVCNFMIITWYTYELYCCFCCVCLVFFFGGGGHLSVLLHKSLESCNFFSCAEKCSLRFGNSYDRRNKTIPDLHVVLFSWLSFIVFWQFISSAIHSYSTV